jgi:hypothetical protein
MLTLSVTGERLAISRLGPHDAVPEWAGGPGFSSITRTSRELSIVCREDRVPAGVRGERGFRLLELHGTFALSEVGILAELARALARAGVSLLATSTFDTDYLMVKDESLERAVTGLREAGHRVLERAG